MFNIRLKELRKEKGISQLELATKLGYNQSMICFWEQGKHEPTESAIRKTALFFNVSSDYLIGLEDDAGSKTYKTYNNYGTHNGNNNF